MKSVKGLIKELLTRGVDRLYPNRAAFENILSKRKIKVYCGYDPSSPALHLGHLITFLKLSQLQELGHKVVMLLGDFTGMIGDPTGKSLSRKKLTRKEVEKNAKNYQKKFYSPFLRHNYWSQKGFD